MNRHVLPGLIGLGTLALTASLVSAPASTAGPATAGRPSGELTLTPLGTHSTGSFGTSAAEIVSFHPATQRAFVVNAMDGTVDVLDLSNASVPTQIAQLATPGANSVAVHDDLVAVAEQAADKTDPGRVVFFDAVTLADVGSVAVGALPDMVTFSPNGRWALVAGEGEPSGYGPGHVDPEGTVAVIDLKEGVAQADVRLIDFTAWNGREDELSAQGIRIFGPGASAAQDLEPEYVAVDRTSRTAYVTLQENNAIARIDIASATIEELVPLGLKDHSLPGNELDADDKDATAELANWPVMGMYQPDSIAAFASRGKGYLVTANEGDARDYDGYAEEARVKDLELDPAVFGGVDVPGRLTVTTTAPQSEAGFTELHAFGGRSISILDDSGAMVWDSGSQLERLVAERDPENFNANHEETPSLDNRSDNKGPEPEGLAVGKVKGRTYVFVGLERVSAIAIFDVTDPLNPVVAGYATNRITDGDPEAGTAGDLGPEGLHFVSADESPTGAPWLIVGNEVSGTTTIWQIS